MHFLLNMDNFPISIFSFKGKKKKQLFRDKKKNVSRLAHELVAQHHPTTSSRPSCECIKSIYRWIAYPGDSSMQAQDFLTSFNGRVEGGRETCVLLRETNGEYAEDHKAGYF